MERIGQLIARVALGLLMAGKSTPSMQEGNTRILRYAVNMTIASRFARTHLLVEMQNEKNCSNTKGFTFQLPLNARVTDLKMASVPGQCEMNGVVKAEEQARQEFAESASQGRPAALLQAYDITNYGVQLSLLPEGRTILEIQLEQLVQRRRGQIDFQVPIYPGLPVDLLTFDLTIDEGTISKFDFIMDYDNVDGTTPEELQVLPSRSDSSPATAHLNVTDVPGIDQNGVAPLPRLLRGFYDPGQFPVEGLLVPDAFGTCFVHLFNPDSLLASTGSLPRNIVFGSMSDQKLEDAQAAFSAIIQRLTSEDYFTVHTFSSDGAEEKFGPSQATMEAKHEGQDFVLGLSASGGTNLEGAYVEGIRQVQSMQTARDGDSTFVPVIMVLTDGQATNGITNPQEMSRNVKAVNSDGVNAKIYGLAFGDRADFNLLSALSLQNGGHATRIYEGYGDAVSQMEDFYVGNLGTIIMSDVTVTFDGTVLIDSQTQTQFPVFAGGSEVLVRARVLSSDGSSEADPFLGATTTAYTPQGVNSWRTEVSGWGDVGLLPPNGQNECVQSFAHAKISELMLFRDAAKTLGPEMVPYYDLCSLQNGLSADASRDGGSRQRLRRQEELDVVSLVKDEALRLAVEAGVVWPGLTAMVTVENGACVEAAENVIVCYDGDGDGYNFDDEDMAEEVHAAGAPMASASGDAAFDASRTNVQGEPANAADMASSASSDSVSNSWEGAYDNGLASAPAPADISSGAVSCHCISVAFLSVFFLVFGLGHF